MYSLIEKRFASAVQTGALVYTASTQVPGVSYGVDVVYTLAPALDKKPGSDNTKETAPKDPWNPPEQALLVQKLDSHSVVLNKFALAKYHFLLVTNQFEPQTSPLSESDWSSAMDLLKTSNQTGKRHVGFYNCGPNSGASIAHKHIQMMTLPDNFKPFPDTVARKPKNQHFEVAVTNHPALPFSHFIAFLETGELEEVITSYYELVNRAFTELAKNGVDRKQWSFNVVFTQEWILVTPRSQEKAEGISINSLGTIGLILAKNQDQLDKIQTLGFDLIKQLGFANEGTRDFSAEIDSHIQY